MRQSGEVVAGFRVERLIGSGGMGEVYLVHHPRLPRLDALKLLPDRRLVRPQLPGALPARGRPRRQPRPRQRRAGLRPRRDRRPALDPHEVRRRPGCGGGAGSGGPFAMQRALHVITRVASALDDAHRHGLLHRDVKPANILLGTPAEPGGPDRVYLTDFGIAKGAGDAAGLTPSGHFAASLDYAAPEQIQMQPLSGKADQYALGCVLFQLLTGSIPFPGDGAWARMNAHLSAPVPRGRAAAARAAARRAGGAGPGDGQGSGRPFRLVRGHGRRVRGSAAGPGGSRRAGDEAGPARRHRGRRAADASATGRAAAARHATARLRGALAAAVPPSRRRRRRPPSLPLPRSRTGPVAAVVAPDRPRGRRLRGRRARARPAFALPTDQRAGRHPISRRGRDGTVRRRAAADPAAAGRRRRPAPHA